MNEAFLLNQGYIIDTVTSTWKRQVLFSKTNKRAATLMNGVTALYRYSAKPWIDVHPENRLCAFAYLLLIRKMTIKFAIKKSGDMNMKTMTIHPAASPP